jgi:methionyl-tRNA formyltransferase
VTPPPDPAPIRPARTIFFGSGAFAVPILESLVEREDLEVVAVVTPPDRPSGRGRRLQPPPAALAATRLDLRRVAVTRVRAPEAIETMAELMPDLGVLADFGQIIPAALIDVPRLGILNVHPSLLPRHRGATPIQATILAGDPMAGVSVMRMDAGLDTGPIVDARAWPLDGTETAPELEARAGVEGAALLGDLLAGYIRGERPARPQDPAAATLSRPLRREDGRLDPARSAVELERQVRAYQPWPGSHLETSAGRLAVMRAEVTGRRPGDRTGTLEIDDDGLALIAADGRLRLLDVLPAGGRLMSGAAYRRGHPDVVGQPVGGAA